MTSRRWLLWVLAAALLSLLFVLPEPEAQADSWACPYPFVSISAGALGGHGEFCDGPTEINGSHWHCEGGGFLIGSNSGNSNGGNSAGINVGLGGFGAGCSWRCPDNTLTVQPNPPGAWKDYLVVRPANNSCLDHMTPAGPTSVPVEADQGPPGYQPPDLLPPALAPTYSGPLPTVTNPGQGNPEYAPR